MGGAAIGRTAWESQFKFGRKYAMKNKPGISKMLNLLANYVELGISLTLFAAILVLLVRLIVELCSITITGASLDFTQFLSKAFTLVIGVEFTRMLCRHTPDTLIEVLMFTIARQLIVAHTGVVDTLIGIVAIGILFAIRYFVVIGVPSETFLPFRAPWKRRSPESAPPVALTEEP